MVSSRDTIVLFVHGRPEAQRERAALVRAAVEIDTDHSPFFSSVDPLVTFIADRHRGMSAA
jgi:hypothetical protein